MAESNDHWLEKGVVTVFGFLVAEAVIGTVVAVGGWERWWFIAPPLAVTLLFGFVIGRWWCIPLGIVPALMQAAIYVNDPVMSRGELTFEILAAMLALAHCGVMALSTSAHKVLARQ